MNLTIDNREKDLITYCDKKNLIFSKANLNLGDMIYNENENEFIIIERKTISDLLASIKDGRYREQKLRLLQKSYQGVNVYYLIEGDIVNSSKSDIVYSCIVNMMIRDNLKIIFSKNIEETYNYLLKLSKKCTEFREILIKNVSTETVQPESSNEYIEVIKSEKKKNMTKDTCYMAMLKQVPGVSANIAKAILKRYGSMNELIKAYDSIENENDKKLLLTDIVIGKRKLGKVLSEKIFNILF
jgi:crossover junction endonuclease MUS81